MPKKFNSSTIRVILLVLLVLILLLVIYFVFFNKSKTFVEKKIIQPQHELLDSRFLILYGYVSNVSPNSIGVSVVKDPTLTDFVFNNLDNVDILLSSSTIIKTFSVKNKTYKSSKISDIKIDSYVTFYIDNATSTEYKAIGLKIFDK